ncbi:MAG: hypothetical protein AAF429_15565 [Pseudomonadota bacterium]
MRPVITALVATAGFFTSGLAAQETEDFDPVFVFNEVCYTKIPNVDAIENIAAQLAWSGLPDDAIKDIRSLENPAIELGWDAKVGERLFRVGVNQGVAPMAMTEPFPGFDGGRATTCSLVLDDMFPADIILQNMQVLAGKEPVSAGVPEGGLKTTTWAGGTDALKVFLFAKVNRSVGGGLLHVTLLEKPQ